MIKVKLFHIASQRIWPFMRVMSRNFLSKRCSQCIVSERYQPLTDGLCKECIEYNKNIRLSQHNNNENQLELDELRNTIHSFCGVGKRGFDALVLFSGGKDSTLLVQHLKTQYPNLRFLAITIDNGLMSPVALENIKIIVDKIGFDHILYKPNDNVFQRSFKYALEQVKGRGCSDVVDRIDGDLFHDISYHLSCKLEIPLVLTGLSKNQVQDIIQIESFILPQARLRDKRTHSGILALSNFAKPSDFENYWWSPEHYNTLPTVVFPNFVWNYSQQEIMKVLHEECGLNASRLDPIVTNNQLIPIMGVIDIRQIGYSSFEPEFSKMVREGKVNREYWLNVFQFLEYLSKHTNFFDADVRMIFEKLQVDEKEVFYGY